MWLKIKEHSKRVYCSTIFWTACINVSCTTLTDSWTVTAFSVWCSLLWIRYCVTSSRYLDHSSVNFLIPFITEPLCGTLLMCHTHGFPVSDHFQLIQPLVHQVLRFIVTRGGLKDCQFSYSLYNGATFSYVTLTENWQFTAFNVIVWCSRLWIRYCVTLSRFVRHSVLQCLLFCRVLELAKNTQNCAGKFSLDKWHTKTDKSTKTDTRKRLTTTREKALTPKSRAHLCHVWLTIFFRVQIENLLGGEVEFKERLSSHLAPCLAQFAVAAGNDAQWKPLNYQVLLKTRHSSAQVSLISVTSIIINWGSSVSKKHYEDEPKTCCVATVTSEKNLTLSNSFTFLLIFFLHICNAKGKKKERK